MPSAALSDVVPDTIAPVLIDRAAAAKLLNMAQSSFDAAVKAGRVIRPLRIHAGGKPRWMQSELLAWLDAGAPEDTTWQRIKASRAAAAAARV